MEKTVHNELKIILIATAVTFVLYASGFLVFFTPFPIIFAGTMYGWKMGRRALILTIGAALVVYLGLLPTLMTWAKTGALAKWSYLIPGAGFTELFGVRSAQYLGLIYFIYFLIFAYLFRWAMEQRWSFSRWMSISVGSASLFLLVALVLLSLLGGSVVEGARNYMQAMMNELVTAQESAGLSIQQVARLEANSSEIVAFSLSIMPGVLVLMGGLTAMLNMLMARWLIRGGRRFSHMRSFNNFHVPYGLVWITITFGFLFFFDRYIAPLPGLSIIALNGLIISGGIYFFQGLIIASAILKGFRARWFKILFYLMIVLFIQTAGPVLALIGLSDVWIDYRKLLKRKKSQAPQT